MLPPLSFTAIAKNPKNTEFFKVKFKPNYEVLKFWGVFWVRKII
ncbi:MAG: hypothetical protein CM15mP126_0120 [Gammaproteobacteria bacterium]|nr:MAG: hypothetical protein CM15mP126_0120 [Gammaproteobacteria bacterium]